MFKIFFLYIFILTGSFCRIGPEEVINSQLLIKDVNDWEVNVQRFQSNIPITSFISLNKSDKKDITFDDLFKDYTACYCKDIEKQSAKITNRADYQASEIETIVQGDNKDRLCKNLKFYPELFNPIGIKLSNTSVNDTNITENGDNLIKENKGYNTPKSYPGYKLIWSDEFEEKELNLQYWNAEIGNGSNGWGNNELQYYTSDKNNVFLSGGNLIIEAREENIDRFKYSSARLTTKGKKEFTFGRVDIRAKLPKGKGVWPALWMLGVNISSVGWPACGEIDIMELIGSVPGTVHGTVHYKSAIGNHTYTGGVVTLKSGDFSQEFHVFSIIWEKDSIKWLLNDKEFYRFTKSMAENAPYPFNQPEFFLFNVAVGGNWPGSPDQTTAFPQQMIVDYIRVFQ